MKKQFLWLAVGATALTACTETDVVEEGSQSNAIRFENIVNKNTRAEVSGDLSTGVFDLFAVYGYYVKDGTPVGVFNGDEVTRDLEKGTNWGYTKTRYWVPGADYKFYAYSCADILLASEKGTPKFEWNATADKEEDRLAKRGLKLEGYKCNSTHQHDLIVAYTEGIVGKDGGNNNVKFTFKHALCKVSAEFANDFPEGYSVDISDVKLSNFYSAANLDIRSIEMAYDKDHPDKRAWTGGSRDLTKTEEITMAVDETNNNNTATSTLEFKEKAVKVPTASVYMLPVYYDNANLNITFTLNVKYNNTSVLKRTIQGSWKPVWMPGRAYKYIIHLTGDNVKLQAIVFETSQDIENAGSWTDEEPEDITFGIADTGAGTDTPVPAPEPETEP